MKKRILSLALVVVMVALVAAGSMAYFTDTTDPVKNTMTFGNVDIELVEKQYVNGAWEEITAETKLGPLQPGVDTWFNKCIFTYNNGDAAYIRNIVAVESADDGKTPVEIHLTHNDYAVDNREGLGGIRYGVEATKISDVKINGTNFDIYVFNTISKDPIAKGDHVMSLTSVNLDEGTTTADAQAMGGALEIYTLSQGIQAAGLTYNEAMAQLGEIDADAAIELFKDIVPQPAADTTE